MIAFHQKRPIAALLFAFFTASGVVFSQNEIPDDPYVALKIKRPTSPAYSYEGKLVITRQVNVDSNGNNILEDAANEPSIAVNKKSPSRMAVGWRQFDHISNNFRQAGFAYTVDGGKKWTFPGPIDPGVFRSDPVLASDAEGRFYYNSLTVDNGNQFACDVYRSEGDGKWDEGTPARGGDKQWMIIDPTEGPGKGNVYAYWSEGASSCTGNFTRSIDKGASYEECTTVLPPVWWGTVDVGPDGKLYALGVTGQLGVSADAQMQNATFSWSPLLVDFGGDFVVFNPATPNPGGLLGQAWIAVNHAPGPLYNQIYALCSVQPKDNPADPMEVMFTKSADGGLTWSAPKPLNDDSGAGAWQWFGTMSVAPNGRIDVVWMDTRDHPGTYLSSLYYTYSVDGGETWAKNERLSDAFDPHLGWPNQQKIGDYIHMISDDTGAHLAWTGTFNGEQDVYYSRISPDGVSAAENYLGTEISVFPNPFKNSVRFSMPDSDRECNLYIFDNLGRRVRELPFSGEAAVWEGNDARGGELPPGVYYAALEDGGMVRTWVKVVKL